MTISLFAFIVIAALIFVCGIGLGYFVSQSKAREELSRLTAQNAMLTERSIRLEGEKNSIEQRSIDERHNFQQRADENDTILRTLTPLKEQLNAMDRSVKEMRSLQDTQGEAIKQQLSQARELQVDLRRETSTLTTALTSTSARGYWGEIELRRLAEHTGMMEHIDFDLQKSTSNFSESGRKGRPDMTIHLPGNTHIAVDAKVPLDALLKAAQLPDKNSAEHTHLRKKHATAFKDHINTLANRNYPADFPDSPPFTIMFVPAESILSDALEANPSLLDDALGKHVIPATPSTLFLTLRTVATMWLNMKATEESEEIIKLGRELTSRLTTVAQHINNLGKRLGKAVESYNDTVGSIERNLLSTVSKLESLEQPQLPQMIDPDNAQIRSFVKLDVTSDSPLDG